MVFSKGIRAQHTLKRLKEGFMGNKRVIEVSFHINQIEHPHCGWRPLPNKRFLCDSGSFRRLLQHSRDSLLLQADTCLVELAALVFFYGFLYLPQNRRLGGLWRVSL